MLFAMLLFAAQRARADGLADPLRDDDRASRLHAADADATNKRS